MICLYQICLWIDNVCDFFCCYTNVQFVSVFREQILWLPTEVMTTSLTCTAIFRIEGQGGNMKLMRTSIRDAGYYSMDTRRASVRLCHMIIYQIHWFISLKAHIN